MKAGKIAVRIRLSLQSSLGPCGAALSAKTRASGLPQSTDIARAIVPPDVEEQPDKARVQLMNLGLRDVAICKVLVHRIAEQNLLHYIHWIFIKRNSKDRSCT